jgi:hypothetical protein
MAYASDGPIPWLRRGYCCKPRPPVSYALAGLNIYHHTRTLGAGGAVALVDQATGGGSTR